MGKFVVSVRKNGEFQFNLKATNGQIIGSSQMYSSERTMKAGIASVMKNAPEAPWSRNNPKGVNHGGDSRANVSQHAIFCSTDRSKGGR